MSRIIPPNGTAVRIGERCGVVTRTGHPPGGVIAEVRWFDTNTLSWHRAEELTIDERSKG